MKEGRAELEHALEVLEQLEPYSLMYWEDDYCEDFYRMTFMGDLEVSIYVSEKPTAFPRLKFLKAPATRLTEAEFFEKLRMVRGEKNNTHTHTHSLTPAAATRRRQAAGFSFHRGTERAPLAPAHG